MTVIPYQPSDAVAAATQANGQQRQLRGFSMVVHADPKMGKSSAADSGFRPVLCMDAEAAATWTPSRKRYWNPLRETVPVADGTWDTAVVGVTGYDVIDATTKILNTGRHPFNSISVDSVPTIQDRIMRTMAGHGKMSQDQWGMVLREITGMIWGFKDLLTHPVRQVWSVVFVCPTHYDAQARKFRPWLLGQASKYVPYVPEVEGFIYAVPDGTRRMWIGPHDDYETGNRLWGRLPDEMVLGYPGVIDGWTVQSMTEQVLATQ